MTFFQAIFLALTQGLTEFLPVSSSGHLVIFQRLFGLEPPVLFDVLIHVGTLLSILVYFRKKVSDFLKKLSLIIIGTLPAIIVGLFLKNYLEQIFNSLVLVGLTLLANGVILISTKFSRRKAKEFKNLTWRRALGVGFAQAVAILPGISRSGSTISSGLWQGLSREDAFEFSLFLAIPAILGALVFQIPDLLSSSSASLSQGILAMLIAGTVGYFSLRILERTLKSAKFWYFGIYCLLLGAIILLFSF